MAGKQEGYWFEIEFDPEAGLVRAAHFGRSTPDDLRRFIDALLTDPRWKPGMKLISDFRCNDPSSFSADDLRDCVAHEVGYAVQTAGTKVATVVDSPLAYGISRIWLAQAALQGSPIEYRIFDSVEAAERWLGVRAKRRRE